MKRLMGTFGVRKETITIKIDNMGAQKLDSNPMYHSRTKHIDIRHHFVRDAIEKGLVIIEHIQSDQMTADILTKGLVKSKLQNCVHLLGMQPIPIQRE